MHCLTRCPLCASTIDLQAAPSSGRKAAKLAKSNCTPAFPNTLPRNPTPPGLTRGLGADYNRANLLMKMEKYDEAISSFDAAIEIDPRFSQGAPAPPSRSVPRLRLRTEALAVRAALANRGVAQKNLGQVQQSESSFEKAKEINPDHVKIETHEMDASGARSEVGET